MSVDLIPPDFDALMRQLNELDDRLRKTTLARALTAGGEVVAAAIGRVAPRSAVPRGPGTGKTQGWRTGRHAADEVQRSKPQVTEFEASMRVGWDAGDNSPHFYMKYFEFGTSTRPASPFMEFALEQSVDEAGAVIAAEVERELMRG